LLRIEKQKTHFFRKKVAEFNKKVYFCYHNAKVHFLNGEN